MDLITLSARLLALADMVRPRARLLDVGTDHAFLPVFLTQKGLVSAALATDIAAGPISRARSHIADAGLDRSVQTLRTPGLENTSFFCATDIVIAGMGGELIAAILDACAYIRSPDILLILQPMTKQAQLRRWLSNNGFAITREVLIPEDNRVYQALCASFTGVPYVLSPLDAEVGALNLASGGDALLSLLARKKTQLQKSVSGKKIGGIDVSADLALLSEITSYLNRKESP